jgi:hypothetical protein
MGSERGEVIEKLMKELLEAGFIYEICCGEWFSSVVMLKKANDKWRMCTDFTNLSKACPKDLFRYLA